MAASAAFAQTPKRGGTLTYMIPADAPPSFDGHREGTFATLHATAPFYSVLIRINPDNPASTTDFVCDLCTEMPTPTDEDTTYTFKLRDGVKFHDGSPLTAADVKASWEHIINPPEGVLSVRKSWYRMVDTVDGAGPDDRRIPSEIRDQRLPAGARRPVHLHLPEGKCSTRTRTGTRRTSWARVPFKFVSYETGQSISGVRNPDYYHPGLPYLDGFTGIFARQAGDAGRRDPQRPRRDGVPRPAALGPRRAEIGARRQDHRAEERLELRQPGVHQPQEEAVRRCPRAPRPDAGDRSLARRAGALQDRQRPHRRRHRLSRVTARRDQGRARRDGRLLARHRKIADRG